MGLAGVSQAPTNEAERYRAVREHGADPTRSIRPATQMKPVDGIVGGRSSGSGEVEVTDLIADIELLGGLADADGPARVAIASYEFVGVVRNGGIGTACTELAQALAQDGHEVDLIFTGWCEDPREEAFDRWRRHYRELGIRLDRIEMGEVANCDAVLHNASHSLALYRMLKARDAEKPYDVIHFVESLGHGFYSLLAKRQGLAFDQATTVVGTHSPRRWLAEAHGIPFDHPIELGDEFLENRCLELADVVVSPSAHMLHWLRARGVSLPKRSYVQQYVSDFDAADIEEENEEPSVVEELVFFGRLEPRKGVVTFCDALDLVAKDDFPALRRVTFLGKDSMPQGYLTQRTAEWPWECDVISNLDRGEALTYLGAPRRLAVMASTMDNSPNTVYEAIGLGISFLASRGGGTAELVHPDDFERVTYDASDLELREIDPGDPTKYRPVHSDRVLAARLRQALRTRLRPARFAVEPAANRETHLAWHRAAAKSPPAELSATESVPKSVDICDLSSVLDATDQDMILLLDSNAEPDPRLAAVLAKAAAATPEAAFITSFGSLDVETPEGVVERVFLPTGGPIATGLIGNCAGAAAALVKLDALQRVAALSEPDALRAVSELLSLATLAGERVDVVPEVLYRLPAAAAAGGSVAYASEPIELLRPYHLTLPSQARDIAAFAARISREEPGLRAAVQAAEQEAAEVSANLAGLVSGRSFRMTAPLRRFAGIARRLRRRGKATS